MDIKVCFNKIKKTVFKMNPFGLITRCLASFLFFPVLVHAQECSDSSVNLGKINQEWLYTNPSIHVSFALPQGWFFFDQLSSEKKYIKIGSDYTTLSAPLADNGPGPLVGLNQIKSHPLDFSLNLFSLAQLQDSTTTVPSPDELQQNRTVSLRAYYAEIQEDTSVLKALYRKYTRSKQSPEIKEAKLGELTYKYFTLAVTNKAGAVENRIYGAVNFGCFNAIIRITYLTDEDLAVVNDACKDLKLSQ